MSKKNNIQGEKRFSLSTFTKKYLAFIGMFIGAGFISGSIVHLGEGINPWDISVLVVGIFFFLVSTCVQEFVFNKKDFREIGVVSFVIYSVILSIGVGMASGGIQHYVDTPTYSAYLIPIGLSLGLFSFFLKEKESLPLIGWIKFLFFTGVSVVISIWGLVNLGDHIPETLLQGQGHSHGNHSPTTTTEEVVGEKMDEDHDHSTHKH